jgi:hypothetical protein
MLMIFAELQSSIPTKKQENTKQKSSEIISFIVRLIGAVSIIALLITLVLLVLWLISIGTLGISIWLILSGIGLFTGLIFLSVLIIEKVLNEQALRC